MRINLNQTFILLLILIILFPPVNSESGFFYKSKDQVISDKNFEGFKFVYFVLTSDSVSSRRYDVLNINYPFLILELIILVGIFLFIYAGKTNEKKIESRSKQLNKTRINFLSLINNIFKKIFFYIKEQNNRSLFWAAVAILTIAIYILEFFTGVSKLLMSLF